MKRLFKLLILLSPLLALGWWIHPWLSSGRAEGNTELSIVSWNLMALAEYGREGGDGLLQLAPLDPDVVCLQEIPFKRATMQETQLMVGGLEYWEYFPYEGQNSSGLAIFSRWPIRRSWRQLLPPEEESRVICMCELDVEGRSFYVATVHFPNSDIHDLGVRKTMRNELLGTSMRTIQAEAVVNWLEPWHLLPLALVGDFNTFPFSSAWRRLIRDYHDAFPLNSVFTGTFQANYDIEVKLDHVFLSDKVTALETRIPRIAGSDHFPVFARIQF
ncbi:MAG: endonuclease/exonuclease/phosphatase family protein [Candidatus Cloacimonetes bacterium]|nr:endonuclease/exonuclease/phosphatase family protein [Candidatus Cloacimonadota bacterium]